MSGSIGYNLEGLDVDKMTLKEMSDIVCLFGVAYFWDLGICLFCNKPMPRSAYHCHGPVIDPATGGPSIAWERMIVRRFLITILADELGVEAIR